MVIGLVGQCRRRPTPPHPTLPPASDKHPFLKGVLVVLDPGHGGADSGAQRGGMSEAQLTYRMAATLASSLQQAGAEVIFTVHSSTLTPLPKEGQPEPPLQAPRDARFLSDNKFVGIRHGESPEDLYRRAQLAAQLWQQQQTRRPIFFLSLHYDALSASKWRGGLICYDARLSRPPQLARELAVRWKKSGLSGHRRGGEPKPRELGVLNPLHNPVPQSVLIELATISNPKDLQAARSPAWRWKVARLIREALAGTLKHQ
nr:N-acetylmuramoyl-L-alanine amidase [Armatimonas rosea]